MPRLPLLLPALLGLCLGGCSLFDFDPTPDSGSSSEDVRPILLVSDTSMASLASDPFEFVGFADVDTTESGSPPSADAPSSDTLGFRVAYGGGCAEHQFRLYGSDFFVPGGANDPVYNNLVLVHDDGGDTCEAYLSEVVRFDLTPLKEHYRREYRQEHGVIELLFDFGDQGRWGVRYVF